MKKMTAVWIQAIGLAGALCLAGPVFGDHDDHGDDEQGEHRHEHHERHRHDRDEDRDRRFRGDERAELERYYRAHRVEDEDDDDDEDENDNDQGRFPADWGPRVIVGRPIPADIWRHRVPLPHEVLGRIAPPPPGVVLIRIHDHVMRVREKTHELLDDLGLPHPP